MSITYYPKFYCAKAFCLFYDKCLLLLGLPCIYEKNDNNENSV